MNKLYLYFDDNKSIYMYIVCICINISCSIKTYIWRKS